MKRIGLVLIAFLCWGMTTATGYTPATLPNPHTQDINDYVCNPDGVLSAETEALMNRACKQLEAYSDVQLAIVAIDSMDEEQYTAFDFCQELFNQWGIGKKDKNTGLLIFLVRNSRDIRLHTGGGLEGYLTDAQCDEFIEEATPLLSEGRYNEGMTLLVEEVYKLLSDPDVQAALVLDYKANDTGAGFWVWYFTIALLFFIFWAYQCIRYLEADSNMPNNIRYEKAMGKINSMLIFAIVFPVPVYLLYRYVKRLADKGLRQKPVQCPECKKMMERLSEATEDEYLSRGQQIAENIKSVDYDVWLCRSCFRTIVLPYKMADSKYTDCPACNEKTFGLAEDHIIRAATRREDGIGEHIYRCASCNHEKRERYRIEKLHDEAAVGAAVANAAFGGSRRGGGGFSGGSFGGGMSFGGGAGGKF